MAQPLDSLVLTSSGYAQISDITAGTKVLTRYGEPAEVTDIFRKKLDVYKISLNDGSCFRVSSTHKNVVYTLKENTKREYTLETLELKDLVDNHTDDKFYVEVTHFDTLESQDDDLFKLDPELLGVLLSSTIAIHESTITISIPLNRLMHVARLFDIIGCSLVVNPDVVRLRPAACCDITSEDLIECLRKATVGPIGNFPLKLNYKILYQPYEYRDKFLAGYMSVRSNQNNQVIFRNQLVDSTVFSTLVRSLGYVDHVKAIKSNDRFTTYIHNVDFQCSEGRYITSIELEGQEDCIAITVDDPDHTYITDYMIPTHNADNLAAKYRPTTFEDMVEQKVIVDIVKNICNSSEISNRNFLFIGPAGVGKTTTARIIANVLNHGQGEPIEIDGASHGNVESIREIISQARTYPIGCDWKIFIVDECHAVSSAAWQSLLLTLESQPAKSIFMLCTTNPEKIPATIISRVQTFQLSKISLEGIFNRLKYIIEQENKEGRNITYTDDALLYIAKLAQGGMRDAITLTDKTLAYSTNITMEVLQEALGLPNYNKYFDMLNAIAKKDNKVIIEIINEVYNSGINFVKWFEGFFGFVTNIVKYIYLQDINQTTIPSTYQDKIKGYGPAHSAICLRLSGLLTKMNQELKSTQYLQEVAISYLCNTK